MLTFQTYLQSNKSDITKHPNYTIVEPGDLVFDITAGIERKRLYTAVVSLVGIEGVVQVLMLNFSELCMHTCLQVRFLSVTVNLCTSSVIVFQTCCMCAYLAALS